MKFVKAKTILSKVRYGDDWYGTDYNMNLYRGLTARMHTPSLRKI